MQSNEVTNSIYRWTRALRVPTLPVLSCVLWPEDMRNVFSYSTLGGVWEPKQCCRSPNLERSSASTSRALLDWYTRFLESTKRRPASQYPRRNRDHVLTAQRLGRRQQLSPKSHPFLLANARVIGRQRRRESFASAGRC